MRRLQQSDGTEIASILLEVWLLSFIDGIFQTKIQKTSSCNKNYLKMICLWHFTYAERAVPFFFSQNNNSKFTIFFCWFGESINEDLWKKKRHKEVQGTKKDIVLIFCIAESTTRTACLINLLGWPFWALAAALK